MPRQNNKFKLTNHFNNINIEELNIAEAPKFLLRSMKNIDKDDDDCFIYKNLLIFMKNNYNNEEYYRGSGITSMKNINLYWNYACNNHTANIPNFTTYFIKCN